MLTSLNRQSTSVANKVLANLISLSCQSRQHEGMPPSNPGGREGAAGLRERQTHPVQKFYEIRNYGWKTPPGAAECIKLIPAVV